MLCSLRVVLFQHGSCNIIWKVSCLNLFAISKLKLFSVNVCDYDNRLISVLMQHFLGTMTAVLYHLVYNTSHTIHRAEREGKLLTRFTDSSDVIVHNAVCGVCLYRLLFRKLSLSLWTPCVNTGAGWGE